MKTRLLIFALVFAAGSLFVNAQPPRKGGKGDARPMATPEMRAEKMAQHLSLTNDQKVKVLELFKQEEKEMAVMRDEMKAMREKSEPIGPEQREKFVALRKKHDADLEKIIGNDKMKQLQAEREEQFGKMKENRALMQNNRGFEPGRPDAGKMEKVREHFSAEKRAERMKAELGLSDSEKDALIQLFKSQEQKIAEERKQKIAAFKKEQDAEIEKIIGKEKMAKFNELRKDKVDKVKKMRKDI